MTIIYVYKKLIFLRITANAFVFLIQIQTILCISGKISKQNEYISYSNYFSLLCFGLGTWTTIEVQKSVEKGYRIIKIYEVWHFPETVQFNPQVGKGGLFTSYVNTFLKLKQEASGWPCWVKSDEDKRKYLQMYKDFEDIELDSENITKNPGMRALAKLMLNR